MSGLASRFRGLCVGPAFGGEGSRRSTSGGTVRLAARRELDILVGGEVPERPNGAVSKSARGGLA